MRRIVTIVAVLAAMAAMSACSAEGRPQAQSVPSATASPAVEVTFSPAPSATPSALAPTATPQPSAKPSARPSPKPRTSTRPPLPKTPLVIKSATLSAAWKGLTFVVTVTIKTTGYGEAGAEISIGGTGAGNLPTKSFTITGTGSNTFTKTASYDAFWCNHARATAFAGLLPNYGPWPHSTLTTLVEKPCPTP